MRNSMAQVTSRDLEYLESLHPRLAAVFAKMDEQGAREDIPIVGTSVGAVKANFFGKIAGSQQILGKRQRFCDGREFLAELVIEDLRFGPGTEIAPGVPGGSWKSHVLRSHPHS